MQKESEIYYQHLIDERGDSALYKAITYIDNQRTECLYDHRNDDGISALIKTLNQNNLYYEGIFQGLGQRKAPSFWMILKAFIKFRLSMPYKVSSFKKGSASLTQTTEAEDFLDTAETQAVYQLCKKQRVYLNAHIIYCVKEVLKDYMQDNSKPMIFMLPINLRAEIIQNDNRGNDVSFIDIKVNKDDSAGDIHRQIISKLKNRMQWGAWLATKMISFIPKFLHKFALKDYVKNTHRTGLISSIGKWNVEKRNENIKLNAIPVNFSHMPFSLSIIDWASALSLGLSLNKELGLDKN
jgi:hypothetical protein